MLLQFSIQTSAILELWIKAIRREGSPSKFSRICGEHFLPTDYVIRPGTTAKLLKPDVVPSLFSFPKHLKPKVVQPRRIIVKHVSNTFY